MCTNLIDATRYKINRVCLCMATLLFISEEEQINLVNTLNVCCLNPWKVNKKTLHETIN